MQTALPSHSLFHALTSHQRDDLVVAGSVRHCAAGESLVTAGNDIGQAFFPLTAVLSMVCEARDGLAVETTVIGSEGVGPIEHVHSVDQAMQGLVVQVPGDVFCVSRTAFDHARTSLPAFRSRLQHFAHAAFYLAAQTSACNRLHSVVERCARWLLLTHDRVDGDEFALTHLHLSKMLGIRRSSVTVAAEYFRSQGCITYTRGRIRVVDRERLQAQACKCYRSITRAYGRLLPEMPDGGPLNWASPAVAAPERTGAESLHILPLARQQ